MVQTSLNIFDLGVIIIVGLSALMSFFRGFTREILSLGAWIIASIVTLYAFPHVSHWIEPQVKNTMVASGLASIGVFLVTLVLISIVSGVFLKFMKSGSEVGALDNIMGLLFGAARGLLLVTISYFIMTLVLTEKDYPEWVTKAATRPYIARSAHWLASLAPDYLAALMQDEKNADSHDEALHKIHPMKKLDSAPTVEDSTPNVPSFDDLQRRVREENEENNAR